jgi:hypothetical protein
MYRSNVEDRYRYDVTFRRVVDQMCSLLRVYHVTPSELREASTLAATMHESENIRPLYVSYDEYGSGLYRQMVNYLVQHPYPSYPAMFGGIDPFGCATPKKPVLTCICAVKEEKIHTATCNHYNWEYWHWHQKPTEHVHIFAATGKGFDMCECGISDVYYNWAYNKKS